MDSSSTSRGYPIPSKQSILLLPHNLTVQNASVQVGCANRFGVLHKLRPPKNPLDTAFHGLPRLVVWPWPFNSGPWFARASHLPHFGQGVASRHRLPRRPGHGPDRCRTPGAARHRRCRRETTNSMGAPVTDGLVHRMPRQAFETVRGPVTPTDSSLRFVRAGSLLDVAKTALLRRTSGPQYRRVQLRA